MKALFYKKFLRFTRTINYFIYRASKRISVRTIILISGYSGAVLGYLHTVGLRSLDVSYIFFSRDAFPPNSYAVEWATNSWSLIHQVGYLGFASGLDHRQMSLAISAVTGAAMVIGLALLIYSISRNGLVAILAAPLIAVHRISGGFDADYPNQYIGSINLSWQGSTFVILTLGVASVGFFRSAGFLAMLTASIHLILGAWAIVLLGFLMALLFFQKRLDSVSDILKGLSIGALLLFASYLVDHFFFTTQSEFPGDDNAFLVWSEIWGHHRGIELKYPPFVRTYIIGAIILFFIKFKKFQSGNYNYTVALIVLFSIFISPLLFIVSHSGLGTLSDLMIQIIPGRFMMFNIFFILVFLIGSLYNFNFRRICKYCYLRPVLIILLFAFLPIYLLVALPVAVISTLAIDRYIKRLKPRLGPLFSAVNFAFAVIFFAGTILFTTYSGVGYARTGFIDDPSGGRRRAMEGVSPHWMEPTDDGAECRDIAVKGLVLVASYKQYAISQRKCGLPALIDPSAINSLPYIPWAASEMRRIISVAYGVNFEGPPKVVYGQASIMISAFRQVWETRNGAEWGRIADEFGVGAVMVPPDWLLDLGPPVAEGDSYKLYSIR